MLTAEEWEEEGWEEEEWDEEGWDEEGWEAADAIVVVVVVVMMMEGCDRGRLEYRDIIILEKWNTCNKA